MGLGIMVGILYVAVIVNFGMLGYLSWSLNKQRDKDMAWNARCRTEIRATLRAEIARLQLQIEADAKENQ